MGHVHDPVSYTHLDVYKRQHLLSPDSSRFANGITVASVQMSKGLEFDEVIMANVDSATYSTEHDRCLLYIGCTRAMQRLTLTYSGTRSVLLDGNRI